MQVVFKDNAIGLLQMVIAKDWTIQSVSGACYELVGRHVRLTQRGRRLAYRTDKGYCELDADIETVK